MESIFVENDKKRHMSINLETGLWQCFKTSRSGNFVSFYCETEKIKYFQGFKKLLKESVFSDVENVSYTEKFSYIENNKPEDITNKFSLVNIYSYNSNDEKELIAWKYLYDRKVLVENSDLRFYICKEAPFSDRVIIPYEKEGILYYYEGRALLPGMRPKYLAPEQNHYKKSDVLYPYNEEENLLVVCEGVFDAISLKLNGLNATSTGTAYVSNIQAEILRSFNGKIIMGYNNDSAGNNGIYKFYELCKRTKMLNFNICFPPNKYKDWNEAYVDGFDVKNWILNNYEKYDSYYVLTNSAKSL